MLTTFASYDEVRAVLGVSDDEVTDDMLVLPLYERLLSQDLSEIGSDLGSTYETIAGIAYATRSAVQKRLYDAVRLYSAYAVAKFALSALPYLIEKRLTDGRAEKERMADPFALVREAVIAGCTDLKYKVSAAYSAINTDTPAVTRTTRTYATATSIALDPVTNT